MRLSQKNIHFAGDTHFRVARATDIATSNQDYVDFSMQELDHLDVVVLISSTNYPNNQFLFSSKLPQFQTFVNQLDNVKLSDVKAMIVLKADANINDWSQMYLMAKEWSLGKYKHKFDRANELYKNKKISEEEFKSILNFILYYRGYAYSYEISVEQNNRFNLFSAILPQTYVNLNHDVIIKRHPMVSNMIMMSLKFEKTIRSITLRDITLAKELRQWESDISNADEVQYPVKPSFLIKNYYVPYSKLI